MADLEVLVRQLQGRMPTLVTALPSGPHDGQEVDLLVLPPPPASAPNDYMLWRFRYDASITDAYKWRFVGGGPLFNGPQGSMAHGTAAWTALTGGPSLTVPVTGGYLVKHQAFSQIGGAGGLTDLNVSVRNGAGANIGLASTMAGAAAWAGAEQGRTNPLVLTKNDVISLNVRSSNAVAAFFHNGWLEILPTRVSG